MLDCHGGGSEVSVVRGCLQPREPNPQLAAGAVMQKQSALFLLITCLLSPPGSCLSCGELFCLPAQSGVAVHRPHDVPSTFPNMRIVLRHSAAKAGFCRSGNASARTAAILDCVYRSSRLSCRKGHARRILSFFVS